MPKIARSDILGFEDVRKLMGDHGIHFRPSTLSMRLSREIAASSIRRSGDLPRPFLHVSSGTFPLYDRLEVLEWIDTQKNGGDS